MRHLRPVQIYGRVWFRVYRPQLGHAAAPPLRAQKAPLQKLVSRKPSMVAPATFRFLHREAALAWPAGWTASDHNKLWLYNLHYFDDLTAVDASDRLTWHRALIAQWLADNPPGTGVGWEPYPLSLRIVNWIKWALAGNSLRPEWTKSLAMQTRWLLRRLEWHLLGNHLLANAKALIFAGSFFAGPEAQQWRERGLSILDDQLAEQILPDGGHFELSPMYHALVLEDLIDLLNLAAAFPDTIPEAQVRLWRGLALRMRDWLAAMSHPDGEIAFFNDAAFGVAAPLQELEAYAARCGLALSVATPQAVVHLKDSGYVRINWADSAAILDVAAVGPTYLPGHAHADTLSFELSIDGRRIVVNGGTSQYGTGDQRHIERGTAAHSTVEIDGADSSEVWGAFRVARRAHTFNLTIDQNGYGISVACSHDGYARLPGHPIHRRTWHFRERGLQIEDRIAGNYRQAMARFHIAPGVNVNVPSDERVMTEADGLRHAWRSSRSLRAAPSTWHPAFGLSVPAVAFTASVPPEGLQTDLHW